MSETAKSTPRRRPDHRAEGVRPPDETRSRESTASTTRRVRRGAGSVDRAARRAAEPAARAEQPWHVTITGRSATTAGSAPGHRRRWCGCRTGRQQVLMTVYHAAQQRRQSGPASCRSPGCDGGHADGAGRGGPGHRCPCTRRAGHGLAGRRRRARQASRRSPPTSSCAATCWRGSATGSASPAANAGSRASRCCPAGRSIHGGGNRIPGGARPRLACRPGRRAASIAAAAAWRCRSWAARPAARGDAAKAHDADALSAPRFTDGDVHRPGGAPARRARRRAWPRSRPSASR